MNDGFRRLHMAMLLLVASACVGAPTPVAAQTQAHPRWLLARVDAPGSTSSFPLSIYAKLQDADGQDYVLVKATDEELDGVDAAVKAVFVLLADRDHPERVDAGVVLGAGGGQDHFLPRLHLDLLFRTQVYLLLVRLQVH